MVTPLADGIWWYDLGGVNAYLIDESVVKSNDVSGVTLVDAGMPWHGSRLIGGIADAGYDLSDIERILLTHYDFDHAGGLADLDGLDATIYVGAADAPLVTGDRRPPWHNHKGLFQRALGGFVSPPTNPVECVTDGDEVGSFTVYETSGHTPGHAAYVSEALSAGLLGDLVGESGGSLQPSSWALSYDPEAVTGSIKDLADRSPSFEVAGMGHGVPFKREGSDRLDRLAARL
ncbi:MBL fold hydrolase [Halobacteriales archaeon QS_4_62_28]|nr:MAG: MBL fold hydrolase [Halobacteriales archaeon QS_4_62_28]